MNGTHILYLVAILAGLLFGSFLNVCIARLPHHQSIAWPGSRCPKCHAPIRPWDNVPILSFVLLRGACRTCRKSISLRYPLVEAATAALFFLCAVRFHSIPVVVETCIFCFLMLGLVTMDLETFCLPDAVTLPGIALGIVQSLFPGSSLTEQFKLTGNVPFPLPHLPPLASSSLGAVGAACLLLLIRWLYRLLRHREGMGLGDVKLAALLGAWLGIAGAALTLMLGILLAAVVGLAVILVLRRPASTMRVPFGSFLCVSGIITLFQGHRLLAWYFGFWR